MTVELREITIDNFWTAIKLKVSPEQERFVASNAVSIAQSKYEPESIPLVAYDGDTMVGFIMYHPEDYGLAKVWFIERLLVGHQFQGKGYGRATMQAVIDRMKAEPGYNAILISFVPENDAARALYSSLGFEDTGEIEEGECVFRMQL